MIRINFFGDFVAPATNSLSTDSALADLIADADYNIVNMEAPAVPDGIGKPIQKSGPTLRQSPQSCSWLEANGFNIISLANNHMMDFGVSGLQATEKAFHTSRTIGAGNWKEAYEPLILECDGKKIGIYALSHCEFGNLIDEWDATSQYGVAWINHPKVDAKLLESREKVDYLIIYAHAGLEYAEQPLPEWRDRYRQLIDLGCDAIIATHPHIMQGWEFYHDHPIVYSLGNFFFPSKMGNSIRWKQSICATLTLEGSQISLKTTPLHFTENGISICKDKECLDYLYRINRTLADTEAYMEYVNGKCLELESSYHNLFVCSGMGTLLSWKDLKRYSRLRLREPSRLSITHMLNNLRCETHRWCILRAMKLKSKESL